MYSYNQRALEPNCSTTTRILYPNCALYFRCAATRKTILPGLVTRTRNAAPSASAAQPATTDDKWLAPVIALPLARLLLLPPLEFCCISFALSSHIRCRCTLLSDLQIILTGILKAMSHWELLRGNRFENKLLYNFPICWFRIFYEYSYPFVCFLWWAIR